MREKANTFFEKKSAENIALIGTILNLVFFAVWLVIKRFDVAFAMVNIVDFDEGDSSSTFYSTLLFFSVSFWIYFAARAKARVPLIISAVFSFASSIIIFGYGLFQPCFYTLLTILSLPFGGSFNCFEPFDSIDNRVVWIISAFSCACLTRAHTFTSALLQLNALTTLKKKKVQKAQKFYPRQKKRNTQACYLQKLHYIRVLR